MEHFLRIYYESLRKKPETLISGSLFGSGRGRGCTHRSLASRSEMVHSDATNTQPSFSPATKSAGFSPITALNVILGLARQYIEIPI